MCVSKDILWSEAQFRHQGEGFLECLNCNISVLKFEQVGGHCIFISKYGHGSFVLMTSLCPNKNDGIFEGLIEE